MKDKNPVNSVTRNVPSKNENADETLESMGMHKVIAWVEDKGSSSKNRKKRYRDKLAEQGIRQHNINLPNDGKSGKVFSKIAKAVCGEKLSTDRISYIAENLEHSEKAIRLVTALSEKTFRARIISFLLGFLINPKRKESADIKKAA